MHIDHGIEEPTQDLPLIEKPTTSGTRSKKTTCRRVGRPRAYRIMIKDDYGGLEVILDVYFPPHVASL
ncbi:hypothetical protein U9M48_043529 [Paspalum notatum var. saurae]|uniref:Uncharacterized protein n=1 Tax=Paspalum notatum var. saurae TaxID=547442 RepID=A0AAQ3XFM9_PASNO